MAIEGAATGARSDDHSNSPVAFLFPGQGSQAVGAVYKLNPVYTHSLQAPGFNP
jgi:acyl transferase domain-containing protein